MLKKNILLIDDSAIDNLIHEKLIKHYNIARTIVHANNGEEALMMLHEYNTRGLNMPDVILVDLDMPNMNGFAFIEALQGSDLPDKENIQVIIYSSSGSRQDIDRAKELGIKHYFTKPLDPAKLIEVLSVGN